MKRNKAMAALLITFITFGIVSCVSMGQFMPLVKGETVVGTVQTTFAARDTWFTHDAVDTLAYIKLLEAAEAKYEGHIEIRDILWVSGREVDVRYKEISATGKVIRLE
jgi:hypothetical protein